MKKQSRCTEWRKKNLERCRQREREYQAKNKAAIAERKRQYYEQNKDAICAYHKTYRAMNKPKQRSYGHTLNSRYHLVRHSAKKRRISFNLTFDEYSGLVKDSSCHYCGGVLSKRGSGLDRKNNDDYSVDSCVPCCGRCNITFMNNYTYAEKLILATAIKEIDRIRRLADKSFAVMGSAHS